METARLKRIALVPVLAATAFAVPLAAPGHAQTSPQAAATGSVPAAANDAPGRDTPAPDAKAAPPPAAAVSPPAPAAAPTPTHPATSGSAPATVQAAPAAAGKPAASAPALPPAVTLADKALAVKPGHYRLAPALGKITWSVNHRGFSTYIGQFGIVAADLVIDPKDLGHATLTAIADITSISTLNSKFDALLQSEDWFDSKAFPQASFKATAVTATGPQTARIDGELTLHGKTAPIVISATFNNAGVDPVDKQYTVGFDAAAIIRRSAFGISRDVPFVGDNVTLRLEGEFKPVTQ